MTTYLIEVRPAASVSASSLSDFELHSELTVQTLLSHADKLFTRPKMLSLARPVFRTAP